MSEQTMVERVARALWDDRYPDDPWDTEATEPAKFDYIGHARAAIEAIRDPTEAEFAAANKRALLGANYQGYSLAAGTWRALIDAALEEGRKP